MDLWVVVSSARRNGQVMIFFDGSICSDFEKAVEKEWIETNGIGGYASSTIIGVNTRGYHGLLIAATRPPLGRMLLLSKVEETLVIGDRRYEISCNQYSGAIHPEGYRYLDSFRLDPFPVFTYAVEDVINIGSAKDAKLRKLESVTYTEDGNILIRAHLFSQREHH